MAPLTFEEILQYHPQNEQILKRLKMQLPHLIPFVGAGLSAFAYPQWAEALKEMAGWVTDTPCQKQVLQLAKQEPLDAAQRLEELLGKTRLVQCMQKVFSSEKLKAHEADLPGEAVYLLPLLFPQSPVITTNFDRILERVYGDLGHPFAHTVLPGRQELLHQMRQEYGHGLFKLHGDVDETMVESGSIVWTREQYNNAYNPEGDLWKELKAWFQNRSALFLGCSLKDDRTMALLQEVMEPGLTHFAIVGCARKERDSRLRELSETFHIQAIVYPKGRHEAVRIILEKLLEETNPPAYQSLTRPLSMLSAPPSSRFAYNAKYIPFTGREQERRQLQAFFHSSEPLKWWAVTGPGGAGKSRLVFEAAEELKGQGWTVQYLKSSSYRTLEKLPLHAGRGALLVADYAQAYVGVIGRWLEELEGQRRSTPLRVLLIERDGQSCEESSWGSQLQGAMQRSRIAKALCYREPFLALQPLQEAELQTILQNYIEAWGKAWKPEEIQSLLQALQTVDPELQRPLYALFVADAWVQGKDPTQWDRKQILQYVLDREQDYTNSKICQLAGGQNQRLRLAVRQIQAVATICGELSLEELQNGYPRLWDSLCQETQKLGSVISEQDFARQAGLLQADGNLAAVRPDLVGEYFVFRHVIEAQTWPLLFPTGWETQLERLIFLYRLIRDYPEALAGQDGFWSFFFQFSCEDRLLISLYSKILVNVSALQSSARCVEAIQKLRALCKDDPDNIEIASAYAKGLFNLSTDQELAERKNTIDTLCALHDSFPDSHDIALEYAKGLVNLSAAQELAERKNTIDTLCALHDSYPDSHDIALEYAKGLFNLSNAHELAERKETIDTLCALHDSYPDSHDIALVYAKGLFNLSNAQELAERKETIDTLCALHDSYPDSHDIALAYANGLVNLSAKQEVAESKETIDTLCALHDSFPDSHDIALVYAQGLVNLSAAQELAERKNTIDTLCALHDSYPDSHDIALAYAKGLFNLSTDQELAERKKTIDTLCALHDSYPNNPEMALAYAKGLFVLACKQEGTKRAETVDKLKKLHESNPDHPEIAVLYLILTLTGNPSDG